MKLILLAAALLAACSPASIDGHEVGDRICQSGADELVGELSCGPFADFASIQLDKDEPGHPAMRDVEVYRDPVLRNVSGYGEWVYVVFRLEDGSSRTYHVRCGRSMDKDWCGAG